MVLEIYMKLYVTEPDFPISFAYPPKLGKRTKNGLTIGLFEFIENLVITFYSIYFSMETCIIFYVPTHIPYLRKFLFLIILCIFDFYMPVYCSCTSSTPGGSRKGPSMFQSVFLRVRWLDFSEFQHDARNLHGVVCDRAWFFGKSFFCPKDWENGPKIGFFI